MLISCKKGQQNESISDDRKTISLKVNDLVKNATPKDTIKAVENVLRVLAQQPNDSITRHELGSILVHCYKLKIWSPFNDAAKLLYTFSADAGDTLNLAKVTRYKGGYFKARQQFDSSFYYYSKSEKFYKSVNNNAELANILVNKSIVQYYATDYVGADKTIMQAYKYLLNIDDKQRLYEAFTMMGIISNELKDFNRAIAYNQKALQVVRENHLDNEEHQEATCLNNIGYAYQNLGSYEQAIAYYRQALEDPHLLKDTPDLYSLLIDNLAYSQFKNNQYRQLPELFYESLHIREKIKAESLVVLSYIHLSEYYLKTGNPILSKEYATNALRLAYLDKLPRDILAALKQASAVDPFNSAQFSNRYFEINDSLQEVERKSLEKFGRIQLETDEITIEKDRLEEQNRSLFYFSMATLMIGLLLFVIRTQRSKNRELLLKQNQQIANEEIYNLMINQQIKIEESRIREKKRIAQELHDGVLGRLFGTRLNLDSLNKLNSSDDMELRKKYLAELKNIEQDIREISHDLNREKHFLINNFVAILNDLFENQRASFSSGLNFYIDENIIWEKIDNTLKIHLYRIIQESLQNINKYAHAVTITVEIKKQGGKVHLCISDDGRGFTVTAKKKGIGLQNMMSRVAEVNGVFNIKSKPGNGTKIDVTIPLNNASENGQET